MGHFPHHRNVRLHFVHVIKSENARVIENYFISQEIKSVNHRDVKQIGSDAVSGTTTYAHIVN